MIPDWRQLGDSRASERFPFSTVGVCALLTLASAFLLLRAHATLAGASAQAQDPSSKPTQAAQQPAATPAKPPTDAQKDNAPLKKAIREKKVLTEDDLAKPAEPIPLKDLNEGEENNSICDLSCEATLKAEFGFTREQDLEFRTQLTIARNDISNDHEWNSVLEGARTAAGQYCELQRQKAEILGNGNVSEYERSLVNARYATRERSLTEQYRNNKGIVEQRIAAVRRFAPLRGSVMQYEWADFANRACPDFQLP